jgi:hypothetical protein
MKRLKRALEGSVPLVHCRVVFDWKGSKEEPVPDASIEFAPGNQ